MSSNNAAHSVDHAFLVPPLDGPVTGGTLFNQRLIESLLLRNECVNWFPLEALQRRGMRQTEALLGTGSAPPGDGESRRRFVWIDTLYLDHVPHLHRLLSPAHRVGLLTHYLPSLLVHGDTLTRGHLTLRESAALQHADCFAVTSPFMRGALERLGIINRPIIVVEPGRTATAPVAREPSLSYVNAIMVANLVSNKGVLSLLHELWPRVKVTDRFHLDVIGSKALEPRYALECATWLDEHSELRSHVRLCGALSATGVISKMQRSNLFVSASPMESYGMALAEARALGLPIIARRGGHVSSLVDAGAGGEVVDSVEQLAESLLHVCRNPVELSARSSAARSHPLPVRSWATAAADFVDQLSVLTNERANETATSAAPVATTTKRQ